MKKTTSRRSNLLLIEIILSILFFSLASAVCLQMFVRANLLGKDAAELDAAVRYACSAAELLSQPQHTIEHMQALYPEITIEGQEAYLWFDQNFDICQEENAVYQMRAVSSPKDGHTTVWSVVISKNRLSDEVYRLEGTTYRQHTLLEDQ